MIFIRKTLQLIQHPPSYLGGGVYHREGEKERKKETLHTCKKRATSHWMIANQCTLTPELNRHFLRNIRRERIRSMQPHNRERMQSRDFGTEKIRPDDGFRAIGAN